MLDRLEQLDEGLPAGFYAFGRLVTPMSQASTYEYMNWSGTYVKEDNKRSK
jgi:hypothetical protein